MKTKELEKVAKTIWREIKNDLMDRRGISHEWGAVDNEIKDEIDETNLHSILVVLKRNFGDE